MLQRLDEDKRVVFIMAELEGMTAPEISAVLSVKASTVYSRLRLARAELERMVTRHKAREEGGRR
jgi:RNA polymerase sigma-70 factor (ECF subfamily)